MKLSVEYHEKQRAYTAAKIELDMQRYKDLMATVDDWTDEDGYPNRYAIEVIERFPFTEPKKVIFDFIKQLWAMPYFGWTEEETDEKIVYHLSTAGWSGNESLIEAMERNEYFLWSTTWVQSRRGGHYIFEVVKDGDV